MSISGVSGTQQDLGKPSGVGLSVAFIWALAAQMLTEFLLVILFGAQGFSTKHAHTGADVVLAVGYLVALGILVSIGEALRSGRQWSWWVIVVLAGALSLGGLVVIPSTIQALTHGDPWSLWAQIILLTLPPFILYRMLQPVTRQLVCHRRACCGTRASRLAGLAGYHHQQRCRGWFPHSDLRAAVMRAAHE